MGCIKPREKGEIMDMIGHAIADELSGKDYLIIFFGSILRDDFDRLSDIDVAVYTGSQLDAEAYWRIQAKFEHLPLLRKIDLVDLATVSDKFFLSKIIEEGSIWKGSEDLLKSLKQRLKDLRRS